MIISHKYKFIFIKLRKTAGTSLEIALSQYCSSADTITAISKDDENFRSSLGFPGSQNIHIPKRYYSISDWQQRIYSGQKKCFYNHMPAIEIKSSVSHHVWDNYFKFCIERNPWDKIISHFYHRGGKAKFSSIMDYLLHNTGDQILGYDMYSIQGKVAVDRVFRYEELPEALEELSDLLKFNPKLSLAEYRAKGQFRTDQRHYREILSKEESAYIEKEYAREIELMGYSF